MANSCDDDFPLLPDDPSPHFPLDVSDDKRTAVKRQDRICDDLSDGESPYCYSNPTPSAAAAATGGIVCGKRPRLGASAAGDYRKDREEWSDAAIGSLLDAYTERFEQLNRGNLRGKDWEDVALIVSESCDKSKGGKSVEQCKNKIDNLKKRYKVECQRISTGGLVSSHWPWFKKMENIVANSASSSRGGSAGEDESKSAVQSGSGKQSSKRYALVACGAVGGAINSKVIPDSNRRWKRALLKISGLSLTGDAQNIDPKVVMLIAREIHAAKHHGIEVALVVGSRNIFCSNNWANATGVDKAATYEIGMMASVMNAMLLQASLEKIGVETRVQTALMMQEIAEPYVRRRAIRHLEKGRVVIFGGIGAATGSPLFTTDTAAALRASEINADVLLKGTIEVGGYGCHPSSGNDVPFEHVSYREYISRGYMAMDITAITFCEENRIPVVLFNMLEQGNISRAIYGDQIGTLVDQDGRISRHF